MNYFSRITLLLGVCLGLATASFAQSDKDWWKMSDQRKDQPAASPKTKRTGPTRGQLAIEDKLPATPEDKTSGTSRKPTLADTLIIRDSTVFVDEMDGFEHYLNGRYEKKERRSDSGRRSDAG